MHCEKTFDDEIALNQHIDAKHKEDFFDIEVSCPYCDDQRKFRSNNALQMHIRDKHEAEMVSTKLPKCQFCSKHFPDAYAL